jgi:CheY-like chemotaxis protein
MRALLTNNFKMAKVLMVDDEPDMVNVMNRLLKLHGHVAIDASNAEEALEKARYKKPDAVVLDIMMPDMNGWEVCRELRSNPKTRNLPIIMLSVLTDKRDIIKSFEYADADWHVSTPFDTETLFFIIDLATTSKKRSNIEKKIEEAIKRDQRMRRVFEMINPKLLHHDYRSLD